MSPPSVVVAPRGILPALAVPRWRLERTAGLVAVGLAFVVYLGVGLAFSLGAGIITGDAWSRVGNAYYVLFSRDPHLAAIGFVWNPLPSLVELPLLPFSALWPVIVDHGVAGNIMSASFMALALREVWLWLRELGTSRPVRIGLSVAFAAHPLILLYGGNGMSEAPFLFFLLMTGRAFSGWVETRAVGRLAVAGIGLALAYLTRYEAVAAIAGVGLATLVLSYGRARGGRRDRAMTALADGLIVGVPPGAAFVLWALASWIIVGSPFETFTSVYGNSSQVGLSLHAIRATTGSSIPLAAGYLADQILGLEPLLPVAAAIAVVAALARRDARIVAPLATIASVVAFSGGLFLAGGSFGWLRFSIGVIPLTVVAVGLAIAGSPRRIPALRLTAVRGLLVADALAVALIGLPVATATVFDARLAREESPQLHGLVAGDREMPGERREFLVAGDVAHYLDAQTLPRGSVVVDVALGFWIVLQSRNPGQFVITPDRDFERVAADPAVFHARYLLVSPSSGLGALGGLEREHPGLYANGAGIATLVRSFGDPDTGVAWRLYQVR